MSGGRLPAKPLLAVIDSRGGVAASGIGRSSAERMAVYRAQKSGHLTATQADRLACALGLHPEAVWQEAWDAIERARVEVASIASQSRRRAMRQLVDELDELRQSMTDLDARVTALEEARR